MLKNALLPKILLLTPGKPANKTWQRVLKSEDNNSKLLTQHAGASGN